VLFELLNSWLKEHAMKTLSCALFICSLFVIFDTSFAGDKKNKLIGVWEVVKAEEAPAGSTVEFTKDGKLILTAKIKGETKRIEATYKVDGKTLMTTRKEEGGKEKTDKLTIQTLNETTLVTLNEKRITEELKRKAK
jgi:uncharacterized protein (TIGR03066 family)